MTELEEGDVVLCTVERIQGATVFVKLNIPGEEEKDGSIVFSEISSGRIRNIRDYVVPKKTIVCTVLRIKPNNVELSLRRVTQDEEKEVREQFKQDKSSKAILKSVLKEQSKEIIKEIEKTISVAEFLQNAKQDSKKLEKLTSKADAKKIVEILNSQKQTTQTIKKMVLITSKGPEGINQIKALLGKIKEAKIIYVSAGKYSFQTEAADKKQADKIMKDILEEISKKAKKQEISITVKE